MKLGIGALVGFESAGENFERNLSSLLTDKDDGRRDRTECAVGGKVALLRQAVDDFGQTVVMVTHDGHAASFADRLLVLADGRIVHDGDAATPDEALDLMKALG